MTITNIKRDVECEEDLDFLPTEMEVPDDLDEDEISDYITDFSGFCHKGFVIESEG